MYANKCKCSLMSVCLSVCLSVCAHAGILMLWSWLLLAASAIFYARYTRPAYVKGEWFEVRQWPFCSGFSTPLRVRTYVHMCISLVSLYAHRLSPCTVTHDVVSLFPLPKVHRAFLAASVVLTDIGFIVIFVGLSGFLNFGVS